MLCCTGRPLNKKLPFWTGGLDCSWSVWDHLRARSGFLARSKSGGFAPDLFGNLWVCTYEGFVLVLTLRTSCFVGSISYSEVSYSHDDLYLRLRDSVFVLVHSDWIYDPETPDVRVPLPLRAVPL